jgi:hypothetical protein
MRFPALARDYIHADADAIPCAYAISRARFNPQKILEKAYRKPNSNPIFSLTVSPTVSPNSPTKTPTVSLSVSPFFEV